MRTFGKSAIGTLLILAFALTGCSAASDWKPARDSRNSTEKAFEDCRYEAAKATASFGDADVHDMSYGEAIADGISEGIIERIRTDALVRNCMRTHGYE